MNDPIRLALIGCGGISQAHIKGYLDLWNRGCDSFIVTAVCDKNREVAKQRASEIGTSQHFTPFVYIDDAELITDHIADAADVCLPHYLHHTIGIRLLSGGLHVLIEKPIGITIKATKKIIKAGKHYGKIVATAEHVRRNIGARAAQWALSQRKMIGGMLNIDVRYTHPGLINYNNPIMKWRGFKNTAGGGMLLDSGAHFADMMICLFGRPETIECTIKTSDCRLIKDVPVFGHVRADVEDRFYAFLSFPDSKYGIGPKVSWTYSRHPNVKQSSFGDYIGEKGKMVDRGFVMHPLQNGGEIFLDFFPNDNRTLTTKQIEEQYLFELNPWQKDRLFPFGCQDGFAIEIWDFIDAIQNRRKPSLNGYDGLVSKAICMACYESATAQTPVTYQDVIDGKIDAYQEPINDIWNI